MFYDIGQNKNLYVLGYFLWRTMTGRQQTIEYLMQVPGKLPSLNYVYMYANYQRSYAHNNYLNV